MFVAVLSLQGCNIKQLNEKMIVQGMGIDFADGDYKVTVMYINTHNDESGNSHKTATGKGRTITEAVSDIVTGNGLEPLYSHNSFVILGRSLCESGVNEAMEFFAGYYQFKPSISVLAAQDSAAEIMNQDSITPEVITRISDNESTVGLSITMPLYTFWGDIRSRSSSACTAFISAEDNKIKSNGIAVFDGDKLSHILSSSQTMGVAVIRGKTDMSGEAIPVEGEPKSFSLSNINTETKVKAENGVMYCNIVVKAEANIYEYISDKKNIEEKIEKSINSIARDAMKECTENGSDIFGFGKRLRFSDKKIYNTVKDWKKFIKNGTYNISSEISVR